VLLQENETQIPSRDLILFILAFGSGSMVPLAEFKTFSKSGLKEGLLQGVPLEAFFETQDVSETHLAELGGFGFGGAITSCDITYCLLHPLFTLFLQGTI
jgi:hypothetical protein